MWGRRLSDVHVSRLEKALVVAMVFAGFAVGYACSYTAVSGTLVLPLTREFGWGRVVPSLMYVAAMFGVVLASLFLGRTVERFGEARVVTASGTALASVMVALSAMPGSPVVAVALAFLAGLLGAGTGVGLYVSLLPKWFDHDLGRALGIAVMGQSAGALIMPPISAIVIAAWGWRTSYLVLATIELVGSIAVALVLRRLFRARDARAALTEPVERDGKSLRQAVRQRDFWLLQATIFLQTLGVFGIHFHLFSIYSDMGLPWASLPRVTIAAAAGMGVGRLVSGVLLDLIQARLVAAGMYLAGAGGIVWLTTLTINSGFVLYVVPFIVGFALGSETDILAYFARRLYGLRHYTEIYNRLLISYFAGAMAGPLFMGWVFDHLTRPKLGMFVLAASSALGALMSLWLPKVRHQGTGESQSRADAPVGRLALE